MTNEEIAQVAKEIKHLNALLDQAEAELERLKNLLKDDMIERQVDEWLTVDDIKITFKVVTSQKFDAKAFRLTHEELYSQYSKPQTVRRLTIA